jgi:hypothetical protein
MNVITKGGFKASSIKVFLISVILGSFVAMPLPVCAPASASATNPASATKTDAVVVKPGETWKVTSTTSLKELTIAEGATVTTPNGYSLTMTVNGVETGQKLVDLLAADGATRILPGTYRGNVVLTVAEDNPTRSFKLRQALYLDSSGIVKGKSVLAAVSGKIPSAFDIKNIQIKSTGECFNGIYVAGGTYNIKDMEITFTGDGRSDFEGYGSAIMATGENTRLVLDRINVKNKGIVRTGLVAAGGSNVIVKNSIIETQDGERPASVLPQRGGSGLGGSIGLCRATVVLGTNTKETFINSTVTGTGWGLLASDACQNLKIAAINSNIAHTGDIGGYGAYAIGNATEWFLGSRLKVSCTGVTLKGGHLYYGDSTREVVLQLNKELDLGLTNKELKSIPVKNTVLTSKLFGIMATQDGTVEVSGGTVFNTGNTTFMNKGQTVNTTVDGSQGAKLNPGNEVIMQLMNDDDPGPGLSYTEPPTAPKRDESFDVTSSGGAAVSTFSNISLEGNFYNSFGWGKSTTSGSGGAAGGPGGAPAGAGGGMPGGTRGAQGGAPGGRGDAPAGASGGMFGAGAPGGPGGAAGGPGGASAGPGGSMPGGSATTGKNMVLNFVNARITGVISASESHHPKPVIEFKDGMWADYKLFGVVTNIVNAPINNGAIVSLTNHSNWTVTGTSYLTSLTIEDGSTITARPGQSVTMTVDGAKKAMEDGSYKGQIVLTVN